MSSILKERVLVLNNDYTAIAVTNTKTAIKLLFSERAEIIKHKPNKFIYTVDDKYQMPSILRLKKWININKVKVPLNKRNIFIRDNYTCAYCGAKENLTLDHMIPKSKGGEDSWDNLVTCCTTCNNKKDDMMLYETKMKLKYKPSKPSYLKWFSYIGKQSLEDGWDDYLMIT
jgi:5-methylcytosine-specific restriction endonuclease McrA